MPTWYKAICLKEIYWHGQTFRQRNSINVIEEDMRILLQAGVIGDIKKIESPKNNIEQTIRKPPENEMKSYPRKARP